MDDRERHVDQSGFIQVTFRSADPCPAPAEEKLTFTCAELSRHEVSVGRAVCRSCALKQIRKRRWL